MKKIIAFVFFALLLCACEGMHDNIEKYYGEIVYPAKYDTIVGHIGYERVEIDLLKAGRIPSEQIKMGKAKKTIIEYDEEKIVIDSLVSWVAIDGLTESKIYRFYVYTLDEYDNVSVSQEIALIPFTASDKESLMITQPRVTSMPSSAIVDWPSGITSVLTQYHELKYSYTDKDGKVVSGDREKDPQFILSNLNPGKQLLVDVKYKVQPKVGGTAILDTLWVERTLEINLPSLAETYNPAERQVLLANGLTALNFDEASKKTELEYPIHTTSFQDLFFFPNLKKLDLTGSTLFKVPELKYNKDVEKNTVGGGDWQPFMSSVATAANTSVLKFMLDAGKIENVKYIPNSMGLDELLKPYVEKGIVELIEQPNEALIPYDYFLNGLVQDDNWKTKWTYPATDAPGAAQFENIYKITVLGRSASFVFALPKEYKYNVAGYKYLKMKVYAPSKDQFPGEFSIYQKLWFRMMNNLWAFSGNSSFGQEYWEAKKPSFSIADNDLQKWIDVTIDMSEAKEKHTRVIVFNIGTEPSLGTPWVDDPSKEITYYFADFKFTKE